MHGETAVTEPHYHAAQAHTPLSVYTCMSLMLELLKILLCQYYKKLNIYHRVGRLY